MNTNKILNRLISLYYASINTEDLHENWEFRNDLLKLINKVENGMVK